jgi:hypothetical protein
MKIQLIKTGEIMEISSLSELPDKEYFRWLEPSIDVILNVLFDVKV